MVQLILGQDPSTMVPWFVGPRQQMMAKGGDKNNPMAAMMGGMGAMGMPNPMAAAAAEAPKVKDKPLTWKDTRKGGGFLLRLEMGNGAGFAVG